MACHGRRSAQIDAYVRVMAALGCAAERGVKKGMLRIGDEVKCIVRSVWSVREPAPERSAALARVVCFV
jgi:hypothetical protein